MAVHLLRLSVEPAEWASAAAIGPVRIAPRWPASDRFALVAVIRGPGPRDRAHTRAFWVTTPDEMDRLLTNHTSRILWFTMARHRITDEMIERTLPDQEPIT